MNNLEKAKIALKNQVEEPDQNQAPGYGTVNNAKTPYPTPNNPYQQNINDIAAFIKAERNRLGWSQRDLARKANYSQGTITRLESRMWVSLTCLVQVANALGKKITLT